MTILDWTSRKTTDITSHVDEQTLAVLPIAATEQHGPHLPLGTDTLILEGLLERLRGRRLQAGRALLLPALPLGFSPEHRAFPGTLSVSAPTLLALWCEIGQTVAEAGIRRLLILNTHGGNSALAQVATMRLRDEAGLLAGVLTTHGLGAPAGMMTATESRFGIHAGHAAPALVRALAPDQVAEDHVANFASTDAALSTEHVAFTAGKLRLGWHSEDLNVTGAIGDAAAAKPGDGEALLQFLTDHIVRAMSDFIAWPLPPEGRPPPGADLLADGV